VGDANDRSPSAGGHRASRAGASVSSGPALDIAALGEDEETTLVHER
jgi:hypothetical protein